MKWQEVEIEVRKIAESVWSVKAEPERVTGVKCDAVLKPRKDYWILIEISKRDDLDKLREDIAKLALVRTSLLGQKIYCECYFVTSGDHTSLRESGDDLNVEVHDLDSFASKFIGSNFYIQERKKSPFGSAVHPDTGEVDWSAYAAISYVDEVGRPYSVSDIAVDLKNGKRIALLGEFGTGKSRCLMEVFRHIVESSPIFPPIAINLRDNWGYKKLHHITANHLEGLGLGAYTDNLVRSLRRGNHVVLLDGFDEIGSQSWSGDPKRLMETRKRSLEGVRDLIANCTGSGILITGREHYFSTLQEMAECLGQPLDQVLVLKCPEEFSEEELQEYIKNNTKLSSVPEWMPRKPLICQLLTRLPAEEVTRLEAAADGELEFFEAVFDTICARETKINPSIYKETLKGILLLLAQKTRDLSPDDEKISTDEINDAFYKVAGYAPIDESAILLQRLPYLGRAGSGGSDRIFIDNYAKDGLRGIALALSIQTSDRSTSHAKWVQPLGLLGLRMVERVAGVGGDAEKYARLCVNHGNSQVGCDFVAAKLLSAEEICDFQGLNIGDGRISVLSFIDATIKNLHLVGVEIGELTIESAQFENVQISACTIDIFKGVGSVEKLPDVFVECEVAAFDRAVTTARISELNLSDAQKTLLAIIKKLFFQPGAGRREEALLRGAERYWDPEAAKKAIHFMEKNGLVLRTRGDHGVLFVPQRKHTRRMAQIVEMQTNCRDEFWSLMSTQ